MPTVTMTSGMNVISRQNRTMAGTARNRWAKAIPGEGPPVAHPRRGFGVRRHGSIFSERRLRTVVLGPPLFGT